MRLRVDPSVPLAAEPAGGHNRWHPDLEPIATVPSGAVVTFETRDGFDGQLGPASTAADVGRLELERSHPLTGPVAIEGAEPGDVLEVEVLDCELPRYGFTAVIPGVGVLADRFPEPSLVPWELDGGRGRSPLLPGVSVPLAPFPGIVGVAPSPELVRAATARERRVAATGALVAEPEPRGAVPPAAGDGLRTIPPRENGGNVDLRQLSAGGRLLLAVERPGALLSVGDLHAAQGDGECCGTALEVAGAVTLRVRLHRSPPWRPRFPLVVAPERPAPAAIATTGIPLTDGGENAALDLGLATRRALLELIDYLVATLAVAPEAAYALCSVAADLRISEAVDAPNALVSALLPVDVFDESPWPLA